MGHQQIDERLQASAVLPWPGHAGGERGLAAGLAVGTDLGLDAVLDQLEHNAVADPALALAGGDTRQIGAAVVTGLDGERFLGGDLLQVGADLVVGLRGPPARLGPLRGGAVSFVDFRAST